MSQLLPWLAGGAPPASVAAAPLLPQLIAGALALLVMVGAGSAMRAHHYLLIPEETKSPAASRGSSLEFILFQRQKLTPAQSRHHRSYQFSSTKSASNPSKSVVTSYEISSKSLARALLGFNDELRNGEGMARISDWGF